MWKIIFVFFGNIYFKFVKKNVFYKNLGIIFLMSCKGLWVGSFIWCLDIRLVGSEDKCYLEGIFFVFCLLWERN